DETDFESIDVPNATAIAGDDTGALAIACIDEEASELVVLVRQQGDDFKFRRIDTPDFVAGVTLAIAGGAVAVSFEQAGVWMSRDLEAGFDEVPLLSAGGPI